MTPESPGTSTPATGGTACPTRSSRPSTRPARCPGGARTAWWCSTATGHATQLNHGRNLGPVNPVLYDVLGPLGARAGISDVVSGNNSVLDPKTGKVLVPGFTAGPGFDVASGWGTIDASTFVPALVAATQRSGLDRLARQEASRELSRLEHRITLSAGNIPADSTSSVSSTGFLPRHPVRLAIDGQAVATLTASDLGTVSYLLDPAALGLAPGHHVLTLQGMLITTAVGFRSG